MIKLKQLVQCISNSGVYLKWTLSFRYVTVTFSNTLLIAFNFCNKYIPLKITLNPFNAKGNFVQNTRMQRFLKAI